MGGSADLYAEPEDTEDLLKLIGWLTYHQIPWLMIGRGYNLLVRDGGVRGAVISMGRFNRIELLSPPPVGEGQNGGRIRAEAGAENLAVVRFAQEHGLGGIGFISGIPGTVGGAVRMNAGAYGKGILEQTECLTLLRNGQISEFCTDELEFGYRYLSLEQEDIVLSAVFRLDEQDPQLIEDEIRKDFELRRAKHNVGHPSAGSFFKNPPDQAAWRLIDAAGMRGTTIGGAQVSEVHSNFLVNRGGATARDFLELAERVKAAVLRTSNIALEEEVRIIGEDA